MKVEIRIVESKNSDMVYVNSAEYSTIRGIGFTREEAELDFRYNFCEVFGIPGDQADDIELEVVQHVML